MQESNIKLKVESTGDDIQRKGDFLVQMNPKHFSNSRPKFILLKNPENQFSIHARVEYMEIDETTIRMDQKFRCAIGLDVKDSIIVEPFYEKEKTGIIRRILMLIFGVQVNLVRVKYSLFNDMEINVCRLSDESLKSININSGDVVIVESPYGRKKIRALELSDHSRNDIKQREEKNPEIFKDCSHLANPGTGEKNNVDLLPILLDRDVRNSLKIEPCSPVRISRSLKSEIIKRLHLISVPIVMTLIGALISFELSDFAKALILIFGIAVVIFINFVSIKIKV